jgi:catechol 2,3-dioxygenase-like lactoylglutathione lyase family enzyme
MLGNFDAIATIAVSDLVAAEKFYEEKLGFKQVGPQEPGTHVYQSGKSALMVYQSQFAGTNKATAATWIVDDAETLARELSGRGIAFEHYEFPQTTRKGDVHFYKNLKQAWFKDPDGNILAVVSR